MSYQNLNINESYEKKYGFSVPVDTLHATEPGLSEKTIRDISHFKSETGANGWIHSFRMKALEHFLQRPMPKWGGDLDGINFDEIVYYMTSVERGGDSWEVLPENVKKTFEKLGIPESERKVLGGVGAQFDSEVVYHKVREDLEKQGVIFVDPDTALQKHADIFRPWFGKVVPYTDNKFAALNSAVFSGGSFIYIPKGVEVKQPLQAYFRINANGFGQFERTLIIADEGSKVHYIEGCSAPVYTKDSLHAAVVEIVALPGSHVRYTTLQNWSKNVYNLVTKRAYAFENATVEWVDANIGSKVTMKYPSVFMKGRGARADILSVAFAGEGQHQDTGAKAVHLAPDTTSRITAKSVSKDGGRTSYRGLLQVAKKAENVKSSIRCDALLLDEISKTDTYPYNDVNNDTAVTTHEASVGKIGEEQLFYLMSRGLSENDALNIIVTGFFDAFAKEIPLEYAVEFNRLIQLEMSGAVG
jgi:Fe-S cluster assembly protein SufB